MKYTIHNSIVMREILGETVLVPVKTIPGGFNGIFSLNETGRLIYDRLLAGDTQEQITAAVVAEYEVAKEQAEADVSEYLGRLVELGIAEKDD